MHARHVDGYTPGTSGYPDSGALLVTARSSLAALNERIAARGGEPVSMERFRPNIVLDGWARPHVEDQLRVIRAGSAELGYCKLAIRCSVALVDQRTGERAGPEPLRTLAQYRHTRGRVAFGVKFSVLRTGTVSVGDHLASAAGEPLRVQDQHALAFQP